MKAHEAIEVVGRTEDALAVVVTGIQEFHQDVPEARAGHNVGLLLRGVARDAVIRGQVVVRPGSIAPHQRGRAEVRLLTSAEGGRTTPCGSGYTPQFYFGATDMPGTLRLSGVLKARRARPRRVRARGRPIALEPGMHFATLEGGRTVGAGIVSSVV